MSLQAMRSLRGQVLATAGLFAVCLPVAMGVVWYRPKFEEYMVERYTVGYAQLDADLKSLSDAADCGLYESSSPDDDTDDLRLARIEARDEIAVQAAPQMESLYQDCVTRPAQARTRIFRSLVASAPDFFLRRAEQTIICGGADQRAAGLELLQLSGHPGAIARLQRLKQWALARKIPDLPKQIDAAILLFGRSK